MNLRIGPAGTVAVGLYLLLIGAIGLIGVAIPDWVAFALAIVAGILVLSGR